MRKPAKIYEVKTMKNKILSIIVCIAMLLSSLSMFSFAADVEIDLGDLFDDPIKQPEINDDDDDSSSSSSGSSSSGSSSSGSSSSSSSSGHSSGSNKKDDKTDKTDDAEEKVEDKEEETKEETEEPKEWVNPFADVKDGIWYYDTVKYVTENGIMNGVEEGKFAPDNTLTRAMLVTILYRVEGSPEVSADSKFSDVKSTDWYGAPVIWAAENGIVNGVTETEFAPNNNITREQIATIIYRYAKNFKNYDVSVGENTNILSYEDFDKISPYAIEPLQYTAGSGIMKGKTESTLNPLDNATRAEAATVVMRFIEGNK